MCNTIWKPVVAFQNPKYTHKKKKKKKKPKTIHKPMKFAPFPFNSLLVHFDDLCDICLAHGRYMCSITKKGKKRAYSLIELEFGDNNEAG